MVLNRFLSGGRKEEQRPAMGSAEKKPQGRWDKYNRPVDYIIGVTPGFAQFRQGAERMALSGVAKKIAFGARQGFDFVEVDFESIAEAYEHGVEEEVRRVIDAQGPSFGFGIHAPVTGEIAIDLGVANAHEWERHHRNLQRTAIIAKKTGAKFILFHTSHRPRPGLTYYLATHEYPLPQYSFTGENLAVWIEKVTSGEFTDPVDGKRKNIPWLKDWFKARFIDILYRLLGVVPNAEVVNFLSTTDEIETDKGMLKPWWEYGTFSERVMFAAQQLRRMKLEYWEKTRPHLLKELDRRIKELEVKQREIQEKLYTPEERKKRADLQSKLTEISAMILNLQQLAERLKYRLETLKMKRELTDEEKKEAENLLTQVHATQEKILELQQTQAAVQSEIQNIDARARERQRAAGEAGYYEALERELETLKILRYKVERCDKSTIPDDDKRLEEIKELLSYSLVYRMFIRTLNGGADPEEAVGVNGSKSSNVRGLTPAYQFYILCEHVVETVTRMNFDQLYELWKQQGSEAPEKVSYEVVAKYMSVVGDPLWKEIVENEAGCPIMPDVAIDLANKGIERYVDPMGNRARIPVQKIIELIITAVACKYIQGHLLVKTPPWNMGGIPEQVVEWKIDDSTEGSRRNEMLNSKLARDLDNDEINLSIYEFCKKNRIHIFVETEQPAPGLEGQLRVMHAHHHIALVKSIENGEHISYTIDFEHLTTNLIDPIKDVEENIIDGDAKYVRMVHINAPRPYGGLHGQIQLFSLDMYILYKWLWLLRKKGMKSAYLIWEWGAAGPPEDSAVALRLMIKHLENDTPPDKLPPEFYGLGPEFEAAQYEAVRMHAMDPIEGLLTLPEHSYSFFGDRARELNKLANWLRNRFKW